MRVGGVLGMLSACLAAAAHAAPPVRDPYAVVHGVTVSCAGMGQSWGSDEMVETLRELRELGVNWIAIHPYAEIGADGTVGGGRTAAMYESPGWLTRPIAEAHRLGLKIMIKPHIAYWGSRFSWAGAITFDDADAWRRFFDSYEAWIVMVARLAHEADAFVVGTELDLTVQHEHEWRRVIAAVRRSTASPLTYSAGWDHYEDVPFWDALDAIAIQAYFPLVDHDGVPSSEELDRAWALWMERLEAFAAEAKRDIVFGELGYNDSADAARHPWAHRRGGPQAEEVQGRCLAAALRALARSKAVAGAFLWKWFPAGTERHANFLQSTPAMRAVIASFWGRPAAERPVSRSPGS